MKTAIIAATAALMMGGVGVASAQTVVITQEQRPVIQKYVVEQQVAPVQLPSDFELSVGATLPEAVEVHRLEIPDMDNRYDYVVYDGRTVLVDPQTRHVVQIID